MKRRRDYSLLIADAEWLSKQPESYTPSHLRDPEGFRGHRIRRAATLEEHDRYDGQREGWV